MAQTAQVELRSTDQTLSKELGGGGDGKVRPLCGRQAARVAGPTVTLRALRCQILSLASDTLKIGDIYDMGKLLGSGVAGQVHAAVHRETSEPPPRTTVAAHGA